MVYSLSIKDNAQDVKIAVVNEDEVFRIPRVLLTTCINVAKQRYTVVDCCCSKCLGCPKCPKCRVYVASKCGERLKAASMRSEQGQFKIDASVSIDFT